MDGVYSHLRYDMERRADLVRQARRHDLALRTTAAARVHERHARAPHRAPRFAARLHLPRPLLHRSTHELEAGRR